jgi:hypothetical protein
MENFSLLSGLHAQATSAPSAKPKHRFDNTKRKGELSEAAFLLKAASLGFGVAKPWGDSERYDFILDSHEYHGQNSGAYAGAPSFPAFGKGGDFDCKVLGSGATQHRDSARHSTLSSPSKSRLRRFADVSEAGARSRNPERRGSSTLPPPRLWRVQLKCTDALRARGYDVQPIYSIYGQGKQVYTANDIDVLVAHIVPLDVWYVLPVAAFSPCKSLRFYPDAPCKRARFEHFREAWHLLR